MNTSYIVVDTEAYNNPVISSVLAAGGACCVFLAQPELFEQWSAVLRTVITDREILPNSKFILVSTELKNRLTEEELNAIILHEQGHIVKGHGNNPDVKKTNGVIDSLEYEVEADLYAASNVGKEVVISALKKMVEFYVERVLPPRYGVFRFNMIGRIIFRQMMMSRMKPRIKHLRNMK